MQIQRSRLKNIENSKPTRLAWWGSVWVRGGTGKERVMLRVRLFGVRAGARYIESLLVPIGRDLVWVASPV